VLIENGQIAKVIASFPVSGSVSRPNAFEKGFRTGEIELELVPQGTLAERMRAAGAGIAAFYTPTAAGTMLADGKETRVFDGREYVLEEALHADFALVRAKTADTLGNLAYAGTSRTFNPPMAMAAKVTIAEVDEIVDREVSTLIVWTRLPSTSNESPLDHRRLKAGWRCHDRPCAPARPGSDRHARRP
jgi:3-oxoacid CoA-transferase A subunit